MKKGMQEKMGWGGEQSHLEVRVGRLDSNTSDFLFKKGIPYRDGHPKSCNLPSCLSLSPPFLPTHAYML